MSYSSILGSLHKVDCESLNSVVQQYDQALEENFTKRGQFEKFRDDYTKLRSRLKTLPEKLEYEAMVPVCSKAICPGKIIHTNEILVLLGENTFVECTAKKAAEIITHRLKNIDDTLNRLEKERELYNSWKLEAERQMVETLGDGTIEIVEDYDEEQEKEWRKGHRDKVRKYHQELGKQRQAAQSSSPVNNVGKTEQEERLWTRLDALELEEEFMEAQAIYEQRITDPTNADNNVSNINSNNNCTVKIRERTRSTKKSLNLPEFQDNKDAADNKDATNNSSSSSGKKVTFSPENIIHNLTDFKKNKGKGGGENISANNDNKSTEGCGEQGGNNATTKELKEEVVVELYKPSESGSENGLYDPIFIRFRHEALSSSTDDNNINADELVNSSEEDSDSDDDDDDVVDYQIVLSPGDIYEQFGPPSLEAKKSVPGADKTPLKSILKPRGRQQQENATTATTTKISHKDLCTTTNVNVKKALCESPSINTVIAAEVMERLPPSQPPVPIITPTDSRIDDIYAMFPGLAPPEKPPESSESKSDDVSQEEEVEKEEVGANNNASIDVSVVSNNCKSSTNRPISLFKRMKSSERASLSSDSTN